MSRLPIFVYGTLRPGEPNHEPFLLGRTVSEVPGRLKGAVLYEGPGYPYALEEAGGVVCGELITPVSEEYGQLLLALDRLEDYAPGDPRNLYERVARDVVLGDGTTVQAWVYLAAPAVAARLRVRGKLIEGGDWRARGC
ncbi:gamma-glutamylcyclotransferase family protein [Streptomyces xiangluensis]|uniref:Gamma-glutamylcyclotransferase family protein n=1 Tax=Streptomyces xiangluensis TaxID=2665720 RepID=A0ABV8Z3S7_9ACTN